MTSDTPALTGAQYNHGLALNLVRFLAAKGVAKGERVETVETFRERYPRALGGDAVEKWKMADVGAGTMPLGAPPEFSRGFLRSVTPLTALERLQPRRVPFLVDLSVASTVTGFAWTPAALPFPAQRLVFTAGEPLEPLKAGAIFALSREAVEFVGAEPFVLDELRPSYVRWLDDALLSPAHTGIAGTRPASITSGATPIASAGSSAANMVEDARRLVASYTGQGGRMQTAVAIMSPSTAVALRTAGQDAFRGLTIAGGDYAGIPAVTSEEAGAQIVLLDQGSFVVADDGQIDFDISSHASVEMDDAPSQDGSAATGVTGASMINLWQDNLRGIKVSRWINWRADGAVAVINGVSYAAAGSPA